MSSTGEPDIPPLTPHTLLQASQSLLLLLIIALFILTFVVQPFRIPSASMEPTLLVGDFLLVNKEIAVQHFHAVAPLNIHRGDVIVFHYPVNPSRDLIKRVVALPGDRIHLRDGRVFLNGQPLAEPYAFYRTAPPDGYRDNFPSLSQADPAIDSHWWIQMHTLVSKSELTVPSGSYFVLGDNRNNSEDSRYWGLVPRNLIIGKPFIIYFSMNIPNDEDEYIPSFRLQPPQTQQHSGPALLASLLHLARWNRVLRIIR